MGDAKKPDSQLRPCFFSDMPSVRETDGAPKENYVNKVLASVAVFCLPLCPMDSRPTNRQVDTRLTVNLTPYQDICTPRRVTNYRECLGELAYPSPMETEPAGDGHTKSSGMLKISIYVVLAAH